MINEIRILSYISPCIETQLIEYKLTEELISMFYDTWDLYENLKHISFLAIPIELSSIFESNPILKILKNSIESDTQSNIIFSESILPESCNINNISSVFKDFPKSKYSTKSIINCLAKWKLPVLIDYHQNYVKKSRCSFCNDFHQCSDEVTLSSCKIPNSEEFKKRISPFMKKSIDQWHINRKSIQSFDLKALAFMVCIFYGVEESDLPTTSDYYIHNGLCSDIKSNPQTNYINIAFSIFRAHCFSSTTNSYTKKTKWSIDWHRNNPFKKDGYRLYRVDVVDPLKTGSTDSGTERLLIATNGVKKYFIAYTSNHDFSSEVIKNRIKTLASQCQ